MSKIKEGGKRKNLPQEVIDKFVHSLLLVEDPHRRQEIVDEVFDRIKAENTEAYLKSHPELNKQKENTLTRDKIGFNIRESRIAEYMTEKYGDDPDKWDFDNTPIDQFSDEDLEDFESSGTDSFTDGDSKDSVILPEDETFDFDDEIDYLDENPEFDTDEDDEFDTDEDDEFDTDEDDEFDTDEDDEFDEDEYELYDGVDF